MAESPLNAKAIRQAHAGIEQIQIKQYQLAALLHRIYYKSKAQHRRAKWFQSISGMRKCFSRLLDMQSVKSKIDESLQDRGVSAKGRSQRGELGMDGREHGGIDALQRAIGQVWSSLWADAREQDGSLVKYDTPPSNDADPASSLLAAKELLVVCVQLQELANRSKISFNLLQIHLRTPPAPTFAPLVLSLLSLCAQIHSACLEALWADGEKTIGVARLYGVFRSVGGITVDTDDLALDGINRVNRMAIAKTLQMVQTPRNGHLERLPRAIMKADPPRRRSDKGDTQQIDLNPHTSQELVPLASYIDDEDLGIAV